MAIRTLNLEMFDKITENSKEEIKPVERKEGFDSMTQDEMEYLYDKSKEELNDLLYDLIKLQNSISQMFCGAEILSCDEAINFFCAMEMFTQDLIPAILEGNHKETYKYCSEELTEEELDQSRVEVFQKLYKKYLER